MSARPFHVQAALDLDLLDELEAILDAARKAQLALADEHEGQLRNAVVELHTRAAACLHLVATW